MYTYAFIAENKGFNLWNRKTNRLTRVVQRVNPSKIIAAKSRARIGLCFIGIASFGECMVLQILVIR